MKALHLNFNSALRLESFTEASTDLNQLESIYLEGCGISVVPNGSFANLPELKSIDMRGNPSVCQMNSSAPGKVSCNFASDNFNNSQEMPGGGDGYCLCPTGQYLSLNSCLHCPASTYSDVPNNWASCTACAPGNVSDAGSTDASQCRDDPLVQAEREKNVVEKEKNAALQDAANATTAKLRAEVAAHEASEERNAALQKAQLQAERANNATAANLRLEQEKNATQERESLIMALSASAVTLLLVVGGWDALYRSHRHNSALTQQLNKVAEQHEELASQGMEIAYLRNWR